MNIATSSSSFFVEGFVIDDETQEVILCRSTLSPSSLFEGFRTQACPSPPNSFSPMFTPQQGVSAQEEPLFSLVRVTHEIINKFIPPNQWIELGEHQTEDGEKTLLFATTWLTSHIRPNASVDIIRVPLLQLKMLQLNNLPHNISPRAFQVLSLLS